MKYIILFTLIFSYTTVLKAKINVVTTLSDYVVLAKQIGKDKVVAKNIVHPNEDPHYVRPKPSFAFLLKNADLFVTTGLDLELWVPTLLNRAGNSKIQSGQIGYVSAADGIPLIDKPTNLSHSEGGLHIHGNPHITTSPINMIYIAKNIATGLAKVDPQNKIFYEKNFIALKNKLINQIFGPKIPTILGNDLTIKLAEAGKLLDFLDKKKVEGKKLISKLGGWYKKALPLRNMKLVTYHKNWGYLEKLLNLNHIGCIELKPGVPPTPRHVLDIINTMQTQSTELIIGTKYYSENKMKLVAEKVGSRLAILEMGINPTTDEIIIKFNRWITQILISIEKG